MRKTVIALFLMITLLLHACCALAADITIQTLAGGSGEITYPAAAEQRLNDWLQTRLGVSDALILLQGGAEITGNSELFSFELSDGTEVMSVRFTQQGKIRFGRYGQVTNAVLLRAQSGEELPLDVLFTDMESAQSALDTYVEENVLPHINTYLDVSELLPVPLENVSLSSQGLTMHYPADRFSYFSGNSGAVEVKYYEIADILSETAGAALLRNADVRQALEEASAGRLCGLEAPAVKASLHEALVAFGTLTEPDYIADGEIYELEAPALRGVQLLADRGAENDEAALIAGVRSSRINWGGLLTGISRRSDCHAALGVPQASVMLDSAAAESYRVPEGWMDTYTAGAYTLKLYFDLNDVFSTVEIHR